jgi:hypothetical protein
MPASLNGVRVRAGLGHPEPELVGLIQQRHRVGQQCLTSRGELHAVRGPVEQHRAQLGLQLPDGPAERGLGHVQPLGGPADVAFGGHRDEVAQQPQFHRPVHTLPVSS